MQYIETEKRSCFLSGVYTFLLATVEVQYALFSSLKYQSIFRGLCQNKARNIIW